MKYDMQAVFLIIVILVVIPLGVVRIWRYADDKAARKLWNELAANQPAGPVTFDPVMVADLPEPAQRYFRYTIRTGAPLYTVAEISMRGQFSLGTKEAPDYFAMRAEQIIAAPTGFVWKMNAERGIMKVSGSDATHWTRFWLMGVLPVARLGGNCDHTRSAFGRYIAEAVFWTPAAVLPGPNVSWEPVNDTTARVIVIHEGMEQSIDLTVDENGRPVEIGFPRWSNANTDKVYRIQPFGGYLSQYRDFEGYRLPTHIEAGNQFGTDNYFPFFIADVTGIRFPGADKKG